MQQSFTFNKLDKLNLIIIITMVGSGSIGYLIRNFTNSDTYSLFDLFRGIAGIIGLVTIPIWVVRYIFINRERIPISITFENLTKLMPILLLIFVGSAFLMVFLMFIFEEPIIFIILMYGGGIAGALFMILIPVWVIAFLYRIIRPPPYKQQQGQSPIDHLQQSFSEGKISQDEYNTRLRGLQSNYTTQGYYQQPQYNQTLIQQPPYQPVHQSTLVIICQSCESQNRDNNAFCFNCGSSLKQIHSSM